MSVRSLLRTRPGTPVRRWATHVVLAVVVAGLAGWAGAVWALTWDDDELADQSRARAAAAGSDRIQEVLAGLLDDGVVVTDDGRYLLDEAGERTVEEAVAAADSPVYVLVWAPEQQVGLDAYDLSNYLEEALEDDLADRPGPVRGIFYVWAGPGTSSGGDVIELGDDSGYVEGFSSSSDLVGDAATTLPRAVRAADQVDWYEYDEGDDWGGVPGGATLGMIIAVTVLGGLQLAGLAVRRATRLPGRLLPGRWSWREDG